MYRRSTLLTFLKLSIHSWMRDQVDSFLVVGKKIREFIVNKNFIKRSLIIVNLDDGLHPNDFR